MDNLVIEATPENIRDTFEKDSIGRKEKVTQFVKLLDEAGTKMVFSVNGGWGSGKTFFVKQAQMFINDKKNYMKHIGYALYFNAWERDCDSDPIISLMYSITKETNYLFGKEDNNKVASLCEALYSKASEIVPLFGLLFPQVEGVKTFFNYGIRALHGYKVYKNSMNNVDIFATVKKDEKLRTKIQKYFEKIKKIDDEDNSRKIVIFVDELDRCNPVYAVKLLERIKHYFILDDVVFVFSIDVKNLCASLKKFYGDNFDAYGYLDKFFDVRIDLPEIDKRTYLFQMIEKSEICFMNDDYKELLYRIIKRTSMELRMIARFISYLKVGDKCLKDNEQSSKLLFSVLIALKLVSNEEYDKFVFGSYEDNIKNNLLFVVADDEPNVSIVVLNKMKKEERSLCFRITECSCSTLYKKFLDNKKFQREILDVANLFENRSFMEDNN